MQVIRDAQEGDSDREVTSQVFLIEGHVSVVIQEGEEEPLTHEIGDADWYDDDLILLAEERDRIGFISYLKAENAADFFKGPLLAFRFLDEKLFIARRGVKAGKEDVEILARAFVSNNNICFAAEDDESESFWLSSLRSDMNNSAETQAICDAFKGVI